MKRHSRVVQHLLLSLVLVVGATWLAGCGDDTTPTTDCATMIVQPSSGTIGVGKTMSLVAQCIGSDGNTKDVTTSATWTSSDDSVATVSSGTVTGVAAGTATMTAEYDNKTGSADITVTEAKMTSLQVTPATATLVPNATQQFTATANYDDGTTEDVSSTATWTSSDDTIVTVDNAGLATGVAEGTATVTASFSGMDGSAAVVVEDAVTAISVSPATADITVGTTQQFQAEGTTASGSTINLTGQATWDSSDTAVATMDTNNPGLANGVAEGTSTITATFNSLSGTATLNVGAPNVTGVQVTCNPTSINPAGTSQCTAQALFDDGSNQDVTTSATWTSSDTGVGTIDNAGLVTGVAPGTTDITATFQSVTSAPPVTITVGDVCIALTVTPPTASVTAAGTQQFQATCTMASGGPDQNVTSQASWQSSDAAIATVDALGLATGVAAGTATITATYSGQQATADLTVTDACITSIAIQAVAPYTAPVTVNKGNSFSLTATGTDALGNTTPLTGQVTWTIAPTTYVGPGTADGEFIGIAVGTGTQITATFTSPGTGCSQATSNSIAVTVNDPDLVSAAIDNPPTGAVPPGGTYQFSCTFTYSDGSKLTATAQATWASSTTATATISNATGSEGLATAVAAGTTTITCAGTNQAGTAVTSPGVTLTVSSAKLVYISLTPTDADLNVGETQQFTAMGHYDDGTNWDITDTVTWAAVDCATPPVAITNFTVVGGLVTAVTSTANVASCGGTHGRVSAKLGNIVTFADVTVTPTTITAIAVDCTAPLTCLPSGIGYQVICTATATYDDSSSGDVTNTAAWSTTNASVATATGGVVTIVGNGTAVVTASQGGVTSPSTGSVTNATVQGVTLTLNTISVSGASPINKGIVTQYTATGNFTGTTCCGVNGGCNYNVTESASWSSGNTAVATVSNTAGDKGKVTGVAAGTASISAALGTKTGAASITVNAACLQKVEITGSASIKVPGNVVVPVGVNGYFSDAPSTPVALDPDDYPSAWTTSCSGFSVQADTWQMTVGAADCAAVDFSVTGCGGTAKTDSFAVDVDTAAVLSALSIEPGTASIKRGTYQDYVAYANFTGYTAKYNVSPQAVWTSNPSSCVGTGAAAPTTAPIYPARRFQHSGTVDCTTTITATYGSKSAQATLQVSDKDVDTVTITGVAPGQCTEGGYPVGVKLYFTALVEYTDGTTATNPSGITYTSSDPSKLSVNGLGGMTVAPSGTTNPTLTATFDGVDSAAYAITILPNSGTGAVTLDDMYFEPASPLALNKNVTTPLKIYGLYANCTEPANTTYDISTMVTSASSNSAIVAVSTTSGGTSIQTFATATTTPVTLSFILGGHTETYQVTVGTGTCYASVAITPASVANLAKGLTQTFVATATTNTGTQVTLTSGDGGNWSSSNSSVLSLTGTWATFLAEAAGSATVKFELSGSGTVCAGGDITKTTINATAPVTTTAAQVVSVVISDTKLGTTVSSVTVPAGESKQLYATAAMTAAPTPLDVTDASSWTSQQGATATVAAGVVTGVAAGTTIVEVTTTNGKKASITVNVVACGTPTVTVTDTGSGALPVGYTREYEASATYGSAACSGLGSWDVTDKATWASSATGVATIASGVATGVSGGTTNITATYKTATSTAVSLNVVAVTLHSLSIAPTTPTVYVGPNGVTEVTLTAVYWDASSNPYTLDPPSVNWQIQDGTVISITPVAGSANKKYTLTGLKVGTSQFRAYSNTIQSELGTATVSPVCITAIAITSPSGDVTWPKGVPFKLAWQCTASDGTHPACTPSFSESGSVINDIPGRTGFASTGEGMVDPAASGTTTITATVTGCASASKDDEVDVTVGTATLSSVALPSTFSMPLGVVRSLPATGTYAGGTGGGTYDLSWVATYASTNTAVVSLGTNPGSGQIISSASNSGTSVVSAAYGAKTSNNCTVTVTTGIELVSIAITAEDNYITGGTGVPTADAVYPAGGYNLQLKAEGTYSDGSKADITDDVAWSLVGTTTYGTVDAAGVFTTGTTTTVVTQEVKAALSGIEGTFDIGIMPGAITTIAIVDTDGSSPTTSIADGSTTNYAAQITITGGSVYWATRNVTWASSDTTKGTIVASGTDAGKFTAVAPGITNISANRGTASSGPVAITVTAKVPSKVWCEPKTGVSLVVGGTAQLKAYVQFTDGSSQEITTDTTNTTWATADDTKVDFVNSGTLPGLIVGKGTTTGVYITPTYDTATDPAVSATGTDRCLVVVQ